MLIWHFADGERCEGEEALTVDVSDNASDKERGLDRGAMSMVVLLLGVVVEGKVGETFVVTILVGRVGMVEGSDSDGDRSVVMMICLT